MSVPHTGHTIKKFDEELATLRDLVLRMGGLVEEQLRRGMQALQQCDAELARTVVKGDREIDGIELRADEEVAQLLALRTPLGIDLRTVLTLAKTVTDLERIGDEAKKIARTCERTPDACRELVRLPFMPLLDGMGRQAGELLNGALDALVRLDLDRAEQVKRADDALDQAFEQTMAAINAHMTAQPATVAISVQALFAAKSLERIGDHAKNVAQYVHYLVEGKDVRHPKANPSMSGNR